MEILPRDNLADSSARDFEDARLASSFGSQLVAVASISLICLLSSVIFFFADREQTTRAPFSDDVQVLRILSVATGAVYLALTFFIEAFRAKYLRLWSIVAVLLTCLLLTCFVYISAVASSNSNSIYGPHFRIGAAVYIVTLLFYYSSAIYLPLLSFLLLIPGLGLIYGISGTIDLTIQASFINYLVASHLIGIGVYLHRRRDYRNLYLQKLLTERAMGELRESEKRERLARDSEKKVVASVDHDIRQPIGSLGIYLSLLKEVQSRDGGLSIDEKALTEKISDCIDSIGVVAVRLAKGKLADSDSKLSEQLQLVDIATIVRKVLTVFLPVADKHGVRIIYRARSDFPNLTLSDPNRLFEILSNLIQNAIKYSSLNRPGGSWLRIITRAETEDTGEKRLVLDFVDNGIGIRQDELDKVLTYSYRSPDALDSNIPGSGIGLALVDELCKRTYQHSIDLKSWHMRGSIFTLKLPLINSSLQSNFENGRTYRSMTEQNDSIFSEDANCGLNSQKRGYLVLVDQVKVRRDSRSRALRDAGFEVRAFARPTDSLEFLENDLLAPDCLIVSLTSQDFEASSDLIEALRKLFKAKVPSLLINDSLSKARKFSGDTSGIRCLEGASLTLEGLLEAVFSSVALKSGS